MTFGQRRGLQEVAIFFGAYLMYFGVRALTQGDVGQAVSNARAIVSFERETGVAIEHDVQSAFLSTPWLVDAANAVYVFGHWPALIGASILLFRWRREHYYRLRNAILLTGLVGLVIFSVFPVAPPRLIDLPLVDTVTTQAGGYRHLFPPSLVNEYAAMPSFHAGWNVLLGVVVVGAVTQWWLRTLAVGSAVAMIVAVVVTANHYIVDVVAGVAIALLGLALLDVLERRRARSTLEPRDVRGRPSGRQRRASASAR